MKITVQIVAEVAERDDVNETVTWLTNACQREPLSLRFPNGAQVSVVSAEQTYPRSARELLERLRAWSAPATEMTLARMIMWLTETGGDTIEHAVRYQAITALAQAGALAMGRLIKPGEILHDAIADLKRAEPPSKSSEPDTDSHGLSGVQRAWRRGLTLALELLHGYGKELSAERKGLADAMVRTGSSDESDHISRLIQSELTLEAYGDRVLRARSEAIAEGLDTKAGALFTQRAST